MRDASSHTPITFFLTFFLAPPPTRRDIGDGRTTVRTGWRTTHRSALYGPGGEPETPSENSPHPSVLVGGVRQRRSCALGWYRPSVGVPGT